MNNLENKKAPEVDASEATLTAEQAYSLNEKDLVSIIPFRFSEWLYSLKISPVEKILLGEFYTQFHLNKSKNLSKKVTSNRSINFFVSRGIGTRRTILAALKKLSERGLISRFERKKENGSNLTSITILNIPFAFFEEVLTSKGRKKPTEKIEIKEKKSHKKRDIPVFSLLKIQEFIRSLISEEKVHRGDHATSLTAEIIHSVSRGNLSYLPLPKAINTAFKLIKTGEWRTPKSFYLDSGESRKIAQKLSTGVSG